MAATVVGVASTAPGYSLAATLGFVTYLRRVQGARDHVDRVHPDGVHRGGVLLPQPRRSRLRHELQLGHARDGSASGWLGGWSSMVADLIDHAEPGGHRGGSTRSSLFGWDSVANNNWATMALGIVFIMGMTWICVVGIELSARTQMLLLVTELGDPRAVRVVALIKVYGGHIARFGRTRRRRG